MTERYVIFFGISSPDELTASLQIVTNVVVQIVILLYLIDNNEQTSWMILMGSGIGVIIEAWKVRPIPQFPGCPQRHSHHAIRSPRLSILVSSLLLREPGFHTSSISKVR